MQDKWKIRLQLMKPVTWAPLMWGVLCGAAASGLHFCFLIPCIWIVQFLVTLPAGGVRIGFLNLICVNSCLHHGIKTLKATQ